MNKHAPFDIELDCRSFNSANQDLSIRLCGSVRLLPCSVEDSDARAYNLEQAIFSRQIWVAHAPELNVRIYVSSHTPFLPLPLELSQKLVGMVCNAKVS